MNPLELRNMIAMMYRGTEIKIPHPTANIVVELTHDGLFIVSVKTGKREGAFFSSPTMKGVLDGLKYYFQVLPGYVYQHINGNVYKVLHIANEDSLRPEYPPTVVYIGTTNGKVWAKPLTNFINKMKRIK